MGNCLTRWQPINPLRLRLWQSTKMLRGHKGHYARLVDRMALAPESIPIPSKVSHRGARIQAGDYTLCAPSLPNYRAGTISDTYVASRYVTILWIPKCKLTTSVPSY